MREQVIRAVKEEKLIAIVRGVRPDLCLAAAGALYEGGIRLMEITFRPGDPSSYGDTAEAIRRVSQAYGGKMYIGAGTVTTPELVELAAEAGAAYIISPDANPEVIRLSREKGMVSIPGCMTPSEMTAADRAGADFIKVFPAGALGADYIKALMAPLGHLRFLAVGGVDEHNIPAFLKAGVCGFGVGGNLANRAWIEAGEYQKVTAAASAMVAAVKG